MPLFKRRYFSLSDLYTIYHAIIYEVNKWIAFGKYELQNNTPSK